MKAQHRKEQIFTAQAFHSIAELLVVGRLVGKLRRPLLRHLKISGKSLKPVMSFSQRCWGRGRTVARDGDGSGKSTEDPAIPNESLPQTRRDANVAPSFPTGMIGQSGTPPGPPRKWASGAVRTIIGPAKAW
jgi:hypothetical protein